jgi:hypothetical protein
MRMLLARWLGLEPADWIRLNFGYGEATSVELTPLGGTLLHFNR